MKRLPWLATIALVPLAVVGSAALASDYGAGPWHPDWGPYEAAPPGAYIDSYGEPYLPLEGFSAYPQGEPLREAAPPQRPWGRSRDPSIDDRAARERGGGSWSEEHRYGLPVPAYPSSPELSPRGTSEYRFRGDERFGASPWGAWPERDGYRFRPLTDQERDRIRREADWWPRAAVEPRGRPELVDPRSPGGTFGYGYESDNWFRRHYGERP